jgi:hypothetical protein
LPEMSLGGNFLESFGIPLRSFRRCTLAHLNFLSSVVPLATHV